MPVAESRKLQFARGSHVVRNDFEFWPGSPRPWIRLGIPIRLAHAEESVESSMEVTLALVAGPGVADHDSRHRQSEQNHAREESRERSLRHEHIEKRGGTRQNAGSSQRGAYGDQSIPWNVNT